MGSALAVQSFALPQHYAAKKMREVRRTVRPNFRHWPFGKMMRVFDEMKPTFAEIFGVWPKARYVAWAVWTFRRHYERNGAPYFDDDIARVIFHEHYDDGAPLVLFDLIPIAMGQTTLFLVLWRHTPTSRSHGITPWNLYFPWAWYENEIPRNTTRSKGKINGLILGALLHLYVSAFVGRSSPHLAAYVLLRTTPYVKATRFLKGTDLPASATHVFPLALATLYLLNEEKDEAATIMRNFLVGLSTFIMERRSEGRTTADVKREVEEMGIVMPVPTFWAKKMMKNDSCKSIPLDCIVEQIKMSDQLWQLVVRGHELWDVYRHLIGGATMLWHRLNGWGEFGRCVRAVFSPHPLTTWLPALSTIVERDEEIDSVPTDAFRPVVGHYASSEAFQRAMKLVRGKETMLSFKRCPLAGDSPRALYRLGVSLTAAFSSYFKYDQVKRLGLALWSPYEEPCIPILLGDE